MKKCLILIFVLFFTGAGLYSQKNPFTQGEVITIETSLGDIKVLLYESTPIHHENMIKLIKEGFYNKQLFHRVIKDFMIQGGDPHSVNAPKGQRLGTGGPGYTIPAEINGRYFHKKGAIAAARNGDNVNPEKKSSGSQFYIVQGRVFTIDELMLMQSNHRHAPFTEEEIEVYTTIGGTPHLDGAYTVFGEVVEGLDVLDKIASMPTDAYDRPVEDIVYSIKLN